MNVEDVSTRTELVLFVVFVVLVITKSIQDIVGRSRVYRAEDRTSQFLAVQVIKSLSNFVIRPEFSSGKSAVQICYCHIFTTNKGTQFVLILQYT